MKSRMNKRVVRNFLRFMMMAVIMGLSGCEDLLYVRYPMDIVNNSPFDISIYMASGGKGETAYPDTTLPKYKVKSLQDVSRAKRLSVYISNPWEYLINSLPSDTLSVFIFNKDTVDYYNWETIRDEYKVLKRYDLSVEDLQNMDWTIVYP